MILRRLTAQHFRRFEHLNLAFTPGLNVIQGPNEAGKSTIHTAIQACLFDNAHSSAAAIRERQQWQSDQLYTVSLEFEAGGEEYLLLRDFQAKNQTLTKVGSDGTLTEARVIESRIRDFLGCSSKEFFACTACVAHDELSKVTGGQAGLSDRLQALVSGGGDTSSSTALAKLDSYLRGLCVGLSSLAKNPGPIRHTRDDLERVQAKQTGLREQFRHLRADKERLSAIDQELATLEERIGRENEMLQVNEQALALNDEIRLLMDKYGRFQRAEACHSRLRDAAATVEELAWLTGKESDAARAVEMNADLKAQENILAGKQKTLSEAVRKSSGFSSASLAAGAAMLGIGLLAGWLITPFLFGLALGGLAVLAYGLASHRDGSPKRALAADIAALELGTAELRERLGRLLESHGFRSVNELLAAKERQTQAVATLGATRTELAGSLGMKPEADLEEFSRQWRRFAEQHGGLALEIQQRREALQLLRPSLLGPIRAQVFGEVSRSSGPDADPAALLSGLRTDLEGLRARRDQLRLDAAGLQEAIDRSDLDPEEITFLEESAAELSRTLDNLQRRKRAVELAMAAMQQAHAETMVSATEALQTVIGRQVERITSGRYRQVFVDTKLAIGVIAPESGQLVDIGCLSRATVDQFYLSARIGLTRLVMNGRRPPLLLDDPFVTFDDQRAEKVMELLQELSQEHQVLLFTCSGRYDRFADQIISLPPPSGPV